MATLSVKVKRVKVIATLTALIKEETEKQKKYKEDKEAYQKAYKEWAEKAAAYIIKETSATLQVNTWNDEVYVQTPRVNISKITKAVGKQPIAPTALHSNHNIEELKNAKAMYELSEEETVKVSNNNAWAAALR